MAWDGYRLPAFNDELVWIQWGITIPDLFDIDLNDYPVLVCQLYWGLKRGFRWPYAAIPPGPINFPMMIKAPTGTGIKVFESGGAQQADWFVWSYSGQVFYGQVLAVAPVSWGNPNEYEGAILYWQAISWADFGWTLLPGWPLP